jgi:TamB, inner membrane protein subunit of TAM complex
VERLKHHSLRLLAVCSAFVLLLTLTALIALNSGMLDQFARQRATAIFNEKFYGRLELQELHLKFPNKVILINPRIYGPGEKTAALEARTLSLKFNFLSLLQPDIQKLFVRHLTADRLSARIIEQNNGKLNLDLVFKSRDPDSTKAPLDLFFCNSLEVSNSNISWSGNRNRPGSWQLDLKDLNLELSSFKAKKNYLQGTIEKMRFSIPQKQVSLQQGSGLFLFSETRSEVLALKVASNKSHAELSATLDHFNIFSRQPLKELALASSFLNVQELALHSDDLKLFYPSFSMPSGIYTIKGNAKGKRESVQLIDALLKYNNSKVALKGELLNLHNREAFAYDLKCDSSKIASTFFDSFLKKESSLKEIASKTGDITFLGNAKGTLQAIKAEVSTRSQFGEVSLSGEASREESEQLFCKGTFVLKGCKPHLFMKLKTTKSLLNASGRFEGRGGKREISQLTLEMKLRDSFWQNQQINEGSVMVKYGGQLINTSLVLNNNQTSFNLDGEIDWKESAPRYHASGKMIALDISKALGSKEVTTNLNGGFALQGSGFDYGMLNVAALIQLSPSAINRFQLKDRSKVAFEIVQNASSSRASIKSDFIDVSAEGDYTFDELIALGNLSASALSREIATQNIWPTSPFLPATATGVLKRPFTVNYRIAAKDISPLLLLFPLQGLALQGSAEGSAVYRNGQCSIGATINLSNLRSRDDFLLKNLSMKADMTCNGNSVAKASVNGRASSITIAGKKSGETFFSALYTPSHLEGAIDLAITDPAEKLSAKFTVTKSDLGYDVLFNHLSMKEPSSFWQAEENSHIILGRRAARFNHFTFAKGPQQAVFDGELSNTQPGSFQCTLSNVELNELKRFALDPSLDRLAGTINASLRVSGNPDSKTSSLKVSGVKVRYGEIMIGTLQANALHNGSQLRFEMHNSPSKPDRIAEKAAPSTPSMNIIDGSGTIPLAISYYPLNIRMVEQKSISATFGSDNLSAQFLKYLLPFLESAEGIIPTTLKIEGSTPKPDIYLTTHLRNTTITIEPTQVSYLVNGEVYVTPKAIELREISLSDNSNGKGVINGVVKLEKLQPTELDLIGKWHKLLLFNKKDKEDETSFGTVTGTTRNIFVHGTLSEPIIEGELIVDAANFSLYRVGANESTKYVGVDKFIEFIPRYPSQNSLDIGNKTKPSTRAEFYHSLIDIVQIKNLRLSSTEPLKCTVIFDRLRGEQLESSINNLSLMVNKNNQQYQLFGSVNVIGGKYKLSNSNFDLQEGGKISWNSADIRNGVMDNLYGSKNISTINQQSSERDNVKLLLAITGTLNEPQVTMGYYLNEQTQPYSSVNMIGGQASLIDPNAELNVISLLLYKQWYVRPGGNVQNSNIGVSSVGLTAGTGILSSRISRAIQNIGGLESFNFNVGMDKRGALSGLDLYFALSVPGTGGKMRFIGTGSSSGNNRESTSADYYGTSQKIEYRVTPKVFVEASRSYGQGGSTTSSTNLQKPAETWGVSVSYKERFQTWDQFWKHLIPSSDKKR